MGCVRFCQAPPLLLNVCITEYNADIDRSFLLRNDWFWYIDVVSAN